MMKKVAIVLAVVIAVIGLGLVLAVRSCTEAIKQVSSPIHSGTRMTLAQFEKITTGMSYAEVVQIVGGAGREMSQSEVLGIKSATYAWDGDGGLGANVMVSFQNDKVATKAQFGLAGRSGDSGTSSAKSASAPVPSQPTPTPSAGVTSAQFGKITTGMSYAEVVGIVGEQGKVMSESEIAGIKGAMYSWSGNGGIGSSMTVMFQNDKVVTKAQLGLR